MTWNLALSIALFGFVTAVTPGPNNTMLLSLGANFGARRTLPYINGIMVGLATTLSTLSVGFGAVLTAFPFIYTVLKVVGFSYIVYLAFKIVRSTKSVEAKKASYIGFVKSIGFQFINPKAWIVGATLATTMIPVSEGFVPTAISILIFLIVTWPGAFIWAALGQGLAQFLSNDRRRAMFNWTSAILLVVSMIPAIFH
ncbi:MAG: LysE family translocator [Microbacteriaceae bacterium]